MTSLPTLEGPSNLDRFREAVRQTDAIPLNGRVTQVIGLVVESAGPRAMVGEYCHILTDRNRQPVPAEVVGFRENRVLLMPLAGLEGVRPGSEVLPTRKPQVVRVGPGLLGRVLNGLGDPIDGLGPVEAVADYPVNASPPSSMERPRVREPLPLGVRCIDAALSVGSGQRIGVFAGSGVGKSTLLGMVARNTEADVNVIALSGERGREVREFLDESLGAEGLRRSVVVVATSDQPSLVRIRSAQVATAIAEYFRDQGKHVLLIVDSVTRLALAQREVGLAIGEPPTTRGYTPSVFAMLPRLLERSGTSARGAITGIYAVLVEGDDMNEPVADAVRGILDGHIVLSRTLAEQNHFPAVDVLQSVSRVMPAFTKPEHRAAASELRARLAAYREVEDLVRIGAYVEGSDPSADRARASIAGIRSFLKQGPMERSSYEAAVEGLGELMASA